MDAGTIRSYAVEKRGLPFALRGASLDSPASCQPTIDTVRSMAAA